MRQYKLVLKLLLRNLFRTGGDKKRSGYIIGAYIAIGIFCIMIAAVLAFVTFFLSAQFASFGLTDELVTMIIGLGCVAVFLFGLVPMLSVLYFSKDSEFFLSLPIKPSVVYIAKLTIVYLSELVISSLMLAPALITVGATLKLGALYYITMLFAMLTSPCLPLLIASVIAIPLMYVVSFFRNRGASASVVLILMFALFFAIYYYVYFISATRFDDIDGAYWEQLAMSMRGMMTGIAESIYPIYALVRFANFTAYEGMSVGVSMLVNAIIYCVTIAALMCLAVLVSAAVYRRGLSGQLENSGARSKSQAEYSASGVIKSLMKKEWRELVRTPAFAFQSLSGVILGPIILIFMGLSFKLEGAAATPDASASAQFVSEYMQHFIFLGMLCMISIGMNIGASTCISREGQNFCYCKIIPVSPETQLKAKVYLYLLVSAVGTAVAFAISSALKFNLWMFLLSAGFLALYDYGYVHFTVWFDLIKPKLEWVTPNEVVKNNRSAIVPVLINICVSFVIMLLPVLLMAFMPVAWVGMAVGWVIIYAIAIASLIVFPRLLYKNASRLYAEITV